MHATTLPEGIASGDVSSDRATLWTRSLELGDVTFRVYIDTGDGLQQVAVAKAEVKNPNRPVKVTFDGLDPGTDYVYRVSDAAGSIAYGSFSTAHDTGHNGLTFGVTGDWRGDAAPYAAISNMDEAGLEFMVFLGDTVYADVPSPAGPATTDIPGLRGKYQEVYGERAGVNFWADVKAEVPVFAMIDDHEVFDNFAGGAGAGTEDRTPETSGFVNDTDAYENGLQVFQEYHPIEDRFYGETGDPATAGERDLYRSQTYGQDAAIFVIDQRSFRDAQIDPVDLSGDAAQDAAEIEAFLDASFDPGRTLLGAAQLDQLKADLVAAEDDGVTWKFIHTPEPIQDLGDYANDPWSGYQAERTELLQFIEDEDISNVVFVAADIHGTFVNNITYTTEPGGPQIATDMWEITTGSVGFWPGAGLTAIGLGLFDGQISLRETLQYLRLPVAPDPDDAINDRDDFLTAFYNDTFLIPQGLDPLGLDDNLAAADGLIDATLLQRDYVSAHTVGWTEFDIDAQTQDLTLTTYGIAEYTPLAPLVAPRLVARAEPEIVSQFVVSPDLDFV
ncbi:MAG: alkaline phosphatase D family protein [Pseudomonadota bacterium]